MATRFTIRPTLRVVSRVVAARFAQSAQLQVQEERLRSARGPALQSGFCSVHRRARARDRSRIRGRASSRQLRRALLQIRPQRQPRIAQRNVDAAFALCREPGSLRSPNE